VQHLLLRFGVVAAVREKKVRYRGEQRCAWQLEITEATSVCSFLERIGAYGKERAIRRALAALRRQRRNPNRGVVPAEVWQLIDRERGGARWRDLAHRLGLGRGWNMHRGTRGVSRDRLRAIASALGSEPLAALATSALYWDRITSIHYVGDEQVYDLTIPGTHNFVANDICVHNTSLALNIAQYVAIHQGKPVGVFSLEMSQQELALRILCSEADVSFSRLRAGHLSQKQWQAIVQTVRRLAPSPLYIDDSPNPSLLEVASKTRRLRAELGLELIILDYLQLMQAGGRYENRNLEIAAISRGLKQLAKELELPIIALSQLSRQPERRGGDHRPQLSDLRESGCLTGDTLVTLADSGARVPIRELCGRPGLAVWAVDDATRRLRPAQVTHAFSTGVKPVFRLTTLNGRSIRATANHRFLSLGGWRRLDELSAGERIAVPHRLVSTAEHVASNGDLARSRLSRPRYCEERSDEAISTPQGRDRFASLAMTTVRRALAVMLATSFEALRLLAESDLYWDPVVSIVPDGEEEVFDLTVPGPHNFVAGEIVVHNSIEQDADLVAFVYRDELYNPDDPATKGLAELILAKHRNGETGTINLVFLGETTTFKSRAPDYMAAGPGPSH
jgi:replicative DNA helicase